MAGAGLANMERAEDSSGAWERVLRFFPLPMRSLLALLPSVLHPLVTEIRLRSNVPVELILGKRNGWLAADGSLHDDPDKAAPLSPDDLKAVINSLTVGSFYALEETIAQGYLALPGGHRVGLAGQVVHESGKIRLIRNISSVNFRIAKELWGIARPLLPLLCHEGRFLKTLLLGPPASGKTTLLRELVREVSNGTPQYGLVGRRVGLVDERSELAGSFLGTPQLDVGRRTDVLDGCPKKIGVYLLLRAMNPQVIATDEIGAPEDFQVIADIINAGVGFIATAHAQNGSEAIRRPGLQRLLAAGLVERLVILSHRLGVGTIESVKAGVSGPELLTGPLRPGPGDA
jgi:stage III sporulation protein AA